MTSLFVESVDEIRAIFIEEVASTDAEREYLSEPQRLLEAEDVVPCVGQFVAYEFEPPGKQGAGRGPGAYVDPLAKGFKKQLAAMEQADRDYLHAKVTNCLAAGYVGYAWLQAEGNPPPPLLGQDPRELWERWMLRLASTALDEALPAKAQEVVLDLPQSLFRKATDRLGLTKLRERAKSNQLGDLYGKAGVTLRIFQSTTEFDVEPHKSQLKAIGNWPFQGAGT